MMKVAEKMDIRWYKWKIINMVQASPLVPARIRRDILRRCGMDLDDTSGIAENNYIGSNKLVMGKQTAINIGGFYDGNAPIILEDYVRCGPYVKILTGTHRYRKSSIRRRVEDGTISESVIIKKGSWIGMGAMILPGITVAEGCIIAAGAVLTKDTEPNGLYAGNPAKRIKDLSIEEDLVESYDQMVTV